MCPTPESRRIRRNGGYFSQRVCRPRWAGGYPTLVGDVMPAQSALVEGREVVGGNSSSAGSAFTTATPGAAAAVRLGVVPGKGALDDVDDDVTGGGAPAFADGPSSQLGGRM